MPLLPKPKRPQIRSNRLFEKRTTDLIDKTFLATDLHVRWVISHALEKLGDFRVAPDFQFAVEIVLAEILNNIVEHGYCARGDGDIQLKITLIENRIQIETIDHGVQMPGLKLPHPPEPDLDVCREDLPEGNFGWFMIRKLTEDLEYQRTGNENHLSMFIAH